MSKITIRFPSKQVQYGYVEVEVDADGWDGGDLGAMYVREVYDFWKGEEAALAALREGEKEETPPPAPKARSRAPKPVADVPLPDEHDAAVELVQEELGATVMTEEKAPWEAPAQDVVTKPRPAKPWEAGGAPLKAATIQWD